MAKPHHNKRPTATKAKVDQARVERRRITIDKRVAGQFRDLSPGQRQKIENSLRKQA